MFKVLSYSSLSIIVKFVIGFLLTKVLAHFLGPSGFALLGNFKNSVSVISSIGSLGMIKGIVRYASETKHKLQELQSLVSTVNAIGFVSSSLISVVLLVTAEHLSVYLFQDSFYSFLFQGIAITIFFSTFQTFFFSILNGLGNFQKVVGLEITLNVINVSTTFVLTYCLGLVGALISIVLLPLFYMIVTFIFVKKTIAIPLHFFKVKFHRLYGSQLGFYALMTLFSSIAFPLVFIAIRNEISTTVSPQAAGYWEAVNQFSYFYFLVITSILLMYGLPKITENTSRAAYQKLVKDYFLKLMPLFGLFLIALFFLRNVAVQVVLTESFIPAESLFFWQLLGDFLRAASMGIVILFHARKMMMHYILTDAMLAGMLYFCSMHFIQAVGVEGAVLSHFLSYSIYLLIVIVSLRKELFGSLNPKYYD